MRTVQSWACELGYGADTMFHRTYFLLMNITYFFTFLKAFYSAGVYQPTFSKLPHNMASAPVLCCRFPLKNTQCAQETTKFGKITQNKGHFTVQCHLRSPILVPIESSCTTSYQDDIYCALSFEFMNLLTIYTRALRGLQIFRPTSLLEMVIVNCP